MLVDVAHDELHDPGDVPPGVTQGKADHVELLVRERTNKRAEVLGGYLKEAQRVATRRQADSTAPTPVELVRDIPVEGKRLLADEDLLDPTARSKDALPDVVRDVTDRPALTAAWQRPLLIRERPQQLLNRRDPLKELVREQVTASTHARTL